MKKLAILAGALALGLGACGQNNGLNIGQGFDMAAEVVGAAVSVKITPATATTGQITVATTKQPTIVFHARPQSMGFKLQSYTVQVLDKSGSSYQSQYQRQLGAIVLPGFICSTSATTLDSCQANLKEASNVATPVNGVALVIDEISRQIAIDCAAGACPTLKMNVVFNGVDDAGHVQSLLVSGVDLSATVSP
ncbi:hypothetical protein [Deinococcus sp.]|uniref:hypothetical protein n=1 Tax=Deinococcus sp. TaxID=47478 RepID=UPI00286E6E58|nr:hypothetical protein [Deinococcus sp.]